MAKVPCALRRRDAVGRLLVLLIAVVVLAGTAGTPAQNSIAADRPAASSSITTTNHPPLPGAPSLYWLVPEASLRMTDLNSAASRFARGAVLIDSGDVAAGLPLVQGADLANSPLKQYRQYYIGVALLGLGRFDEAERTFTSIENNVEGYFEEAVPLRRAEVALARGDAGAAADILADLSDEHGLAAPEDVLLRLGAALEAAGRSEEALKAYRRVYYEFPLSGQAAAAESGIGRLQTPASIPPDLSRLELQRAERLFSARRWAEARTAFAALVRTTNDAGLTVLRLAECDYYLKRYRAARDALGPNLRSGSRAAEARFFYLSATRALGNHVTYVTLARELVADYAGSTWAEETLNNLASHYAGDDNDEAADRVYRELAETFPRGRYADRAAWKIGWRSYTHDRFAEAAETFERAAAAFSRADYRPSWLYWAGRSRDRLGERAAASSLYRVVAADYQNSYYGRLAAGLLADRREPPVRPIVVNDPPASTTPLVRNDAVVRGLIAVALYDAALNEVEYARRAWGDSVPLQATVAWIRHRRGLGEGASERFADVRGAITMMRRAYPQFMASGGERLPPDILRVIFPLDYWPLIKKYSEAHQLDPYLMSALIAQESTFTADVRSSANAVGLMQLIPATGRRYARKIGISYSARTLTEPETNIRLGMRYFKDLMDRFNRADYAVASYNAGEGRVARWIAERPGFEPDEFIDDIPFAETQNYVKRILGTADDYRRLYGGGVPGPSPPGR